MMMIDLNDVRKYWNGMSKELFSVKRANMSMIFHSKQEGTHMGEVPILLKEKKTNTKQHNICPNNY